MNRREVLAAALSMPLAACSSSLANLSPIGSDGVQKYVLGPGDEIRVAVIGFDQMANTYTVGDGGSLSLPMLGTIQAGGKSTPELEQSIADLLRSRELATNANVSVQMVKYRPFYILGEVQRPGQYSYVPGMTLMNAVAIAGGYTFRANTRKATVSRQGSGPVTRGTAGPDTAIQPGDMIVVPEAWF